MPPPGGKQVRIDPAANPDWFGMHIAWHFRDLDHEGPFGWHVCDRETLVETIMKRIESFETMRWKEIPAKLLHPIKISDLAPAAQKRLEEIEQMDIAELWCLRIGKKPRVWGIRDRLYFRVLWWDPDHAVYQMNVKDN